MKTIQNCLALSRRFISTSTLFPQSLKAVFVVLLVAGCGFAFGQASTRSAELLEELYYQPFHAMTISDGCEEYITVSGPNSDLVSKKFTVIKRGTYQYQLKLALNSQGAWGTYYSIDGEMFNENDELILITASNIRTSLRILEVSADGREGSFGMSTELLERMATDTVTTLFIKNNVKNQMLKFTVGEEARMVILTLMNCILKMR